MGERMLSTISSIATLILFAIYFVGRTITILSVKSIWKDEVIFDPNHFDNFGIVEEISLPTEDHSKTIIGLLVSKEGIRNLSVFEAVCGEDGLRTKKGNCILKRPFLNIGEAVAFYVMTGDLFPTLIIEYTTFDYMKVRIEWRDNLKNGVFSELVHPRHTIESFLYYLCK